VLGLGSTHVYELPQDLGAWLPQLEALEVFWTGVSTIPTGLTRLTRLHASNSFITQVAAVQHLVVLKELYLDAELSPPFQPLSHLTALEVLRLGSSRLLSEQEAATACVLGPLPHLRSLGLRANTALLAAGLQLVKGAQQLTELVVQPSCGAEQLAGLSQLGVLPQLQRLYIHPVGHGTVHDRQVPAAAVQWLRQQPRLTCLYLVNCSLKASLLEQLPSQLEYLDVGRCSVPEQPAALSHMTRLRALRLPSTWKSLHAASCLTRLEALHVPGIQGESGWAVLAQLPLLRARDVSPVGLPYIPHLFWGRSSVW
jgi:Leucine-rich repeat (LRR) protein